MNVIHDIEEVNSSECHNVVHNNASESIPFSTVFVNNSTFSYISEISKPTTVDGASANEYPIPTASTPYHTVQNSAIESPTSLPLTYFSLSDFRLSQRGLDRSQEVASNFTQIQKDREEF